MTRINPVKPRRFRTEEDALNAQAGEEGLHVPWYIYDDATASIQPNPEWENAPYEEVIFLKDRISDPC